MNPEPLPRLPAEWEPQDALLMAWSRPDAGWGAAYPAVTAAFLHLIAVALRYEPVILIVPDGPPMPDPHPQLRPITNAAPHPLTTVAVPLDDCWVRDFGPLGVHEADGIGLLDFTFNGWGGRFPATRDNAATRRLGARGILPARRIRTLDLILEGGSIDSDGQGTLLTTRRCLLHPARNAARGERAVEALLSRQLGARRILWLDHGWLAGDDTDGHIDMLARFCAPDTIAHLHCDDPRDPHHAPLRAMTAQLGTFRTRNGNPYRLVPLPLPRRCMDRNGKRLPASYANFLLLNGALIMPRYGVPEDETARRRLAALFPDRQVVPVDARPFIHQSGSIHCLTMQLPRGSLNRDSQPV